MNIGSPSQSTDFALDVLGRYMCNTFDEALANSEPSYRANATDRNGNSLSARGDMRPFDFIVVHHYTFFGAQFRGLRSRLPSASHTVSRRSHFGSATDLVA